MRLLSPIPSRAFTLLEITLVISVLIGLISVTFVGVHGYKHGVNRAHCLQNIAMVQRAVRAHAHLHGLESGDESPGLRDHITGRGTYVPLVPKCGSGGKYTYGGEEEGQSDIIPEIGTLYLRCSIEDHAHKGTKGW